jgi:hypothetical protein
MAPTGGIAVDDLLKQRSLLKKVPCKAAPAVAAPGKENVSVSSNTAFVVSSDAGDANLAAQRLKERRKLLAPPEDDLTIDDLTQCTWSNWTSYPHVTAGGG